MSESLHWRVGVRFRISLLQALLSLKGDPEWPGGRIYIDGGGVSGGKGVVFVVVVKGWGGRFRKRYLVMVMVDHWSW